MEKMNILQIIPDLELAGAETMCENLTNELNKNHNVAIISFFSKHTDITNRLEKNGIKIYYLDKKKGPNLKIINKIKNIINEFNPDIIHTHRYCLEYVYPAVKISNKKNVKIVHTVHNIAEKEVPKFRRIIRKMFMINKVTYVAISDIVQKTIHNEYKIDYENIPVVLNGINLSNCIIKEDYKNKNILINIGRLSEQKNQIFLIKVFHKIHLKHPEYKLKIIGAGPLEENIKDEIKKYDLQDYIILEKNKASCYSDLNESDIFVMTSKWEGVPMTIIEALGTGLPIVTSNVGGISNMIENEKEGFLLELEEDLFVSKIIELILDEKKRKCMGIAALEKSNVFSSKIMADNYLKIYERN